MQEDCTNSNDNETGSKSSSKSKGVTHRQITTLRTQRGSDIILTAKVRPTDVPPMQILTANLCTQEKNGYVEERGRRRVAQRDVSI